MSKKNVSSSSLRLRRIYKTLNNLKITLLCGFVTILVLRGTIGFGNGNMPSDPGVHEPGNIQEVNRVLSEIKKDDDDEEEEEDPTGLLATYSLGPKIFDWDEQRRSFAAEFPELVVTRNGRPRVMLVTGSPPKPCANPVGDHHLLKSIKNKIDYCRVHNIEIFYSLALLDRKMTEYWSKLPLIHKLMLAHPEVEWFWWMDNDAMFTDMVFEIPLDKYSDHNLVVHGWDNVIYQNRSWVGLNAGVMLIRNCQWSLDLMDVWAPMGPKGKIRNEAGKLVTGALSGRPDFEADDQSALIYLMVTQREKWGVRVFLESSYYLHGFWVVLVDKFEEMVASSNPGYGDERWPFVTHFVGCKPCGSYGDYPLDKCMNGMERSFNLGDNQILQIYGFAHQSLASFKVKRTRPQTANPLEFEDRLHLLHPLSLKTSYDHR